MTPTRDDDKPAAQPPEPVRSTPKRWVPSLVWLIPIVAAIAGLLFAYHSISNHGPQIEISFRSAEGLEAGKTKVRYKDVDIGQVHSIRLAKDLSHVIVDVDLTADATHFAVKDSRFWVVKPRIDANGVSGLGTLLSGAYIGADPGGSDHAESEFTGLEVPPIVTTDTPGKQFILKSQDLGSLDIGSPVYFRRVNVGQVVAYDLDKDGGGVTVRIFVSAPYDGFVTTNTRFWHSSGIDIKLDADGLKLQTQSLATVVLGGVSFLPAPDLPAGQQAQDNASFKLAVDQEAALKSEDGAAVSAVMYFEQSVRGLSPGAPVDFRGVTIGQVRSIGVEFHKELNTFLLPVVVDVYPSRLEARGGHGSNDLDARRRLVDAMVNHGLRAQLRTGNLLTGQMYVALDFFKGIGPAKIVSHGDGSMMELPTVPGTFDEMQTKIAGIIDKIGKVPFDTLGNELKDVLASTRTTMDSTDKLVQMLNGKVAPEIITTMQDARKTLESAQSTLSSDAPVQQDLRRTLKELGRAANTLNELTDYLEQNPQSLLRGKSKEEK